MPARPSSVAVFALSVSLFAGCAAPVAQEDVGGSSDRMTDNSRAEATSRALVKDLEGETVKVLFEIRIPFLVWQPLLLGSSSGNKCFLVAKEDKRDRFLTRGTSVRIGAVTEVFEGSGLTRVTLPLEGAGADISCEIFYTRAGESLPADDVLGLLGARLQVGEREPARDLSTPERMIETRQ